MDGGVGLLAAHYQLRALVGRSRPLSDAAVPGRGTSSPTTWSAARCGAAIAQAQNTASSDVSLERLLGLQEPWPGREAILGLQRSAIACAVYTTHTAPRGGLLGSRRRVCSGVGRRHRAPSVGRSFRAGRPLGQATSASWQRCPTGVAMRHACMNARQPLDERAWETLLEHGGRESRLNKSGPIRSSSRTHGNKIMPRSHLVTERWDTCLFVGSVVAAP